LAEGFDLSHFGAAPTKFDEADLWPLTANVLQEMDVSDMAAELAALGVPDDLAATSGRSRAPTSPSGPRSPNGGRCSAMARRRWSRTRTGTSWPRPSRLLPEPPYGPETWGDWTGAVKEATGRKGKGLFMPLRKAVTGRERGPEMADVMRLLQKKPTL
jgi:glutamyl-tRNA synthetase